MPFNQLLIDAAIKNIALNNINNWNNELIDKAPPVLYFGNSKSEKPKILTFGANPSRWEFLDQTLFNNNNKPFLKSYYQTKYLAQNRKRFYHLNQNQQYSDIVTNASLRKDIIDSYDNYFQANNPYRWFGNNKTNSYNAEGVLRGMCASYFEIETKYRACHIDLFPFSTISDFNKIQAIVARDVLANNWAKNLVDNIIKLLDPTVLIIFGKSNYNYFCSHFNVTKGNSTNWTSLNNKGKCDYFITNYNSIKVIGLSVNLGNPKGFDALGLNDLGRRLRQELNAIIPNYCI